MAKAKTHQTKQSKQNGKCVKILKRNNEGGGGGGGKSRKTWLKGGSNVAPHRAKHKPQQRQQLQQQQQLNVLLFILHLPRKIV